MLFTFHRQQAIRMKILLMAISVIALSSDASFQASKLQVNSQFEVWRRDLLIQQTCKSLLQRWCIDSDLNFQLIRRQFRQSRFGSMEVGKLANYAFASSFK